METQTARRRLEEMLVELDGSARTLEGEHAGEDPATLTHLDSHTADPASELTDRDRETALLEGVAAQRSQVVDALARIDDGSYGRCVDCGSELSAERLEARPEAARCLEDQQKQEAAR